MKLDPDLIRKILIAYEELPYGGGKIEIPGNSEVELLYHQEKLQEAGYINVNIRHFGNNGFFINPNSLTFQGHEFLNASRNDDNWNKVKDVMAKSGGFVLDVAKAMLIELLKNQMNP